MKLRQTFAALSLAVIAPLTLVACGSDDSTGSTAGTSNSSTTSSTSTTQTDVQAAGPEGGAGGGPGGVDPSSVTTEAQLVSMIQSAYGEANLGLHRGHQPVEDVLDSVLQISHDELHVRMEEQGQNLEAVASDLDIDPQKLIDAMTDKYAVAIDALLESGTIDQAKADAYRDALEAAFTFRVTWDGQEATPTFTGV